MENGGWGEKQNRKRERRRKGEKTMTRREGRGEALERKGIDIKCLRKRCHVEVSAIGVRELLCRIVSNLGKILSQ